MGRCLGWFASFACVATVACSVVLSADPAAEVPTKGRPNLTGLVVAADGKPVASARVSIYTAAVRQGSSPFCPSCYADCEKSAATAADGSFAIERLDPQLIFRVLVVAEGYAPAFLEKVDPAAGPVRATLAPVPAGRLDPDNTVGGVVLAPDGMPVVGATVEPFGCKDGDRRWWGSMPGVDPLAVTNARGEFALHCEHAGTMLDVKVAGRGLAPQIRVLLRPGDRHELRLDVGASVRGRLLRDGQPVAGATVGLVQADRRSEGFLGHVEIGTDRDGRFSFANLAPQQVYYVYPTMASLGDRGALRAQSVRAGPDGSDADAGDLVLGPSRRVAGRVVCSDGKPLPPRTRVLVSREHAWDSLIVDLDADGGFRVSGLPDGEPVLLSVAVKGYRLSAKNKSLDRLNVGGIGGLVTGDTDGLRVLLEPGRPTLPDYASLSPEQRRELSDSFVALQSQPLRGAEE